MDFKKAIKSKIFRYALYGSACVFFIWFFFLALPAKPFDVPYCKVMYSADGYLLNAQVAADQQWRFPEGQGVTPEFEQCIITFEDKNFRKHFGISLRGIGRAAFQNISKGRVVSGGSTITMQTIRLMKQNPKRTWMEKLYEMTLALRLEMRYSKKEILVMYAMHAPFGNNVVGYETACWRYFGKKPAELSWSENALLAVLPNAPGLLYPGKNHKKLQAKRDRLLYRLYENKIINEETLNLSLSEPVPDKPLPLPDMARHYFGTQAKQNNISNTTLNYRIQEQCRHITENYAQRYQGNQVQNIAIVVSDIRSGKVLAYIGNTQKKWNENTSFVDCAHAARSSGSVLKPLLYYQSLSAGIITPESRLFDVPVSYNHFTPQNYARTYEGLIPAKEALAKSLNIPMVGLLNEYGLQKFHNDLKKLGFRHLNRSSSNYGLSLILGSGEVTLMELNQVYTKWAAQLYKKNTLYNQAAIYETLEAMTALNRPDENGNWKAFVNTQKIAWKTGTSFGNRDAWSVGISSRYVVAVWVGNADGAGRSGLTGIEYAAPVLFDVFNALPRSYQWFSRPDAQYGEVLLCKASGYKAGAYCSEKESRQLPIVSRQVALCPFHHNIPVNAEGTYRVNASVYDWRSIKQESYFILPPLVANYFKSWNPHYKMPPPWHPALKTAPQNLRIIFPDQNAIISFGTESLKEIHLKAVTEKKESPLYWHIDDQFIGTTTTVHELQYTLAPGKHELMILDESGNQQKTTFEIVKAN